MNILTFDIEEWFHILDNETTKDISTWKNFEIRIHSNLDKILSILDGSPKSATFFVLGWIVEKYPDVVKKIIDCGYELGSHSYMHQLAYLQSPKEFEQDISRSIKILQDLTGDKIRFFRAPGFSITDKNIWCFEKLHELGIEIDCSVFPIKRAHGGMPNSNLSKPFLIKYNGIKLKEFPLNVYEILGRKIVFSGGGYFRLLPYSFINRLSRKSDYIMSYFHPRDFDPDQPKIRDLSFYRMFKSYVGLKYTEEKLRRWLFDLEFIDLSTADKRIDWNSASVLSL